MASLTRSEILRPEDFEAIREAVMETPRGRWFLEHYADRIRNADSTAMLAGMQRLEAAVAANHDTIMSALTKALANAEARTVTVPPFLVTQVPAPPQFEPPQAQPDLAPKHMKFFKQDEEIFEPAPQAQIAAVPDAVKPAPKPEVPKGARVVIRRSTETVEATIQPEPAKADVPAAAEPVMAEALPSPQPASVADILPDPALESQATASPDQADAQPKRRIVIIRHKPGEAITVPLQNEAPATEPELAEAG